MTTFFWIFYSVTHMQQNPSFYHLNGKYANAKIEMHIDWAGFRKQSRVFKDH